ncbi:unnamed protein product [Euphydryas editha]|uniref:C2H2-type domain-containing protein n=2 Tax=Euphydryas editha TaxID=104508 RepID=A0AAU9UXK2_EUPED|nr:unnamed protein product [Euphydryas editha]
MPKIATSFIEMVICLQLDGAMNLKSYEDEESGNFVCLICKKTFYNANALRNHKAMQHDSKDSGTEDEQATYVANANDQVFDGILDFKFIPLNKFEKDPLTEQDGITKRTFSVDTSYLIIRYESNESARVKRSRLDNMIKRIQSKPEKKPVDLRGPFTCSLPSTSYPSTQCRQIFFNCCEYSLHYREEHTKRRKAALRCQVCEKSLDRNLYQTSALTTQLEPRDCPSFSCRTCGFTFLDSFQFDEHNRIVHVKMKPHQCSICAKRFTQLGGLQQHMRMHSGIRPFVCKFCTKAFTQKAGLDQHLRTHTKVKPFKCIICCKCFSQSVHLRQHMRTHTNIQPFGCPICSRRFKQSSHLNFHMRSHFGEASAVIMEQYAQAVQRQGNMDFLNLSNVQPVQDGETIYYEAQLTETPTETASTNPYFLQLPITNNNII